MTIRWNDDQRGRVSEALRRFPYDRDRCAAAARLVLPVGMEVDDRARGLQITGRWGAPFIFSKTPKRRQFYYHVLVEADAHRVDAFTGEDGCEADGYLAKHWDDAEYLKVEAIDVYKVDAGIQNEDEGL